ncbi:MAG TPA: hypothetical protein VJT50_12025, partial [Pyrinomonadaceae bacterium]|nr:hypothetical protein [Pyrinomonadaceae bacterium]
MSRPRLLLIAVLSLIFIVAVWLWWMRPVSVDLARYAPADSLLYLEANNPTAIIDALHNTDALKILNRSPVTASGGHWFRSFVRWTGIGPSDTVILSRAQLAIVITQFGTTTEADTVTVKPEGALIIETHTSGSRVNGPMQRALQKFSETIFGTPTVSRKLIDGQEFSEWSAPNSTRQIVATHVGSVLIIGNTERSVQKVVRVVLGHESNLLGDGELQNLRKAIVTSDTLALGYVPAKSSPQLLSAALPLVLGHAPDNAELSRLVTTSAANIIGNLGWTCRVSGAGIEDRYHIAIQRSVIAQLDNAFATLPTVEPVDVKAGTASQTVYRFAHPDIAWQALNTAVSSHVDAVSAILFTALFKSALLPYGVSDPMKFFGLARSPVTTARIEGSSNSLLIAGSNDDRGMAELLTAMGYARTDWNAQSQTFTNSESEFTARLAKGQIVIGSADDVARYPSLVNGVSINNTAQPSATACVMTFADDSRRVQDFLGALLLAGASARQLSANEQAAI